MPSPPLKGDGTHFWSCLCSSRAARSPRYKWSHGNRLGQRQEHHLSLHLITSAPRAAALETPLTLQEMVPNPLTCLRCTLSPARLPIQTHLLAAGKWHRRRHFSWCKSESLLPQKCQEAFRCWWCGHKTCRLVLLVSYFFAMRIRVLLPSSSFPQQASRLRPKHAVRVTKEPTLLLFALNNCISTLCLPFWAVYRQSAGLYKHFLPFLEAIQEKEPHDALAASSNK